jgi:hypothetical protein
VSELITCNNSDESESDGLSAEEKRGCKEAEIEQLFKEKPETSHGHYTAAYATALVPYSSSSPSASEQEDEQSWPEQQAMQQAATLQWTLPPWP